MYGGGSDSGAVDGHVFINRAVTEFIKFSSAKGIVCSNVGSDGIVIDGGVSGDISVNESVSGNINMNNSVNGSIIVSKNVNGSFEANNVNNVFVN